jgi:DNA polymerase (family 10)
MKNAALSEVFGQMADIMEILGEDRFRINSYRKVSRIIGDIPADIELLLETGRLADTPGIGKSSLAKIEEFIKVGSITVHQELLARIPPRLLDLLQISGMGPKGVKAVYDKLNVASIADLKTAIENGSLAQLPGFGDKKGAVIARGIAFLEKSTGRIRLDQALEAAGIVGAMLRSYSELLKIQTAGSPPPPRRDNRRRRYARWRFRTGGLVETNHRGLHQSALRQRSPRLRLDQRLMRN